jgi:hypothetical protein
VDVEMVIYTSADFWSEKFNIEEEGIREEGMQQ